MTGKPTPTDAELFALIKEHLGLDQRRDDTVINRSTGRFHDAQRYRDFAAAVLAIAKWGQPAQARAGAVPLDKARRLFDAGWKAAALFCDREDVVADGVIGFGACPQFEAAFSAANGIKGGQHGTE